MGVAHAEEKVVNHPGDVHLSTIRPTHVNHSDTRWLCPWVQVDHCWSSIHWRWRWRSHWTSVVRWWRYTTTWVVGRRCWSNIHRRRVCRSLICSCLIGCRRASSKIYNCWCRCRWCWILSPCRSNYCYMLCFFNRKVAINSFDKCSMTIFARCSSFFRFISEISTMTFISIFFSPIQNYLATILLNILPFLLFCFRITWS